MTKNLQNRRQAVFQQLKNNSFALFHSGYEVFKTADATYPFFVNANFYYLTNLKESNIILIIGRFEDTYYEWLFIDENDERKIKWVGEKLYIHEASKLSGINEKNILYNDKFESFMTTHLQPLRYSKNIIKNLYLDLERRNLPLYQTFALKYAKKVTTEYPSIKIENIYQTVINLRMIKDNSELDNIKQSISTTKNAIYKVMNNYKSINNEQDAEAYYNFVNTEEGKKISFDSIIASGKNATTLHYVANNSPTNHEDLLLMDVGCYTNHYSSDISRTFPLSGKFSKRQKEVYEVVLNCNKKCIEYARNGISWEELNSYAKSLLIEGCKKLGLIKNDEELSEYYYHSIGHSLGLDVHDPDIWELGLKTGMVITIEPGLYIAKEQIGIRIEDNILIGEKSSEVLSIDIVKEVADIEKLMAK